MANINHLQRINRLIDAVPEWYNTDETDKDKLIRLDKKLDGLFDRFELLVNEYADIKMEIDRTLNEIND